MRTTSYIPRVTPLPTTFQSKRHMQIQKQSTTSQRCACFRSIPTHKLFRNISRDAAQTETSLYKMHFFSIVRSTYKRFANSDHYIESYDVQHKVVCLVWGRVQTRRRGICNSHVVENKRELAADRNRQPINENQPIQAGSVCVTSVPKIAHIRSISSNNKTNISPPRPINPLWRRSWTRLSIAIARVHTRSNKTLNRMIALEGELLWLTRAA